MAVNSCKGVDLLRSPGIKDREAYAIGRSIPLYSWLSTAPHANLLASVVMQKGLSKSGYCSIGGFISAPFKY